jgi:hypothetical protein
MKKLFVVVLLSSAAVVACHGKKPSTTAPAGKPSPEHDGDSTGGATYGGHKGDAPGKGTPNPCAAH